MTKKREDHPSSMSESDKGKSAEKPVSLHPLEFEEALRDLVTAGSGKRSERPEDPKK
jgi:hypothetical protein